MPSVDRCFLTMDLRSFANFSHVQYHQIGLFICRYHQIIGISTKEHQASLASCGTGLYSVLAGRERVDLPAPQTQHAMQLWRWWPPFFFWCLAGGP